MVDRERALDPVFGQRAFAQESSRVVNQHVEPAISLLELRGELADGILRGQIAEHQLDAIIAAPFFDLLLSHFAAMPIATSHHDRGAKLRESKRCLFADTGVCAGDDTDFTGHRYLHRLTSL